MRASPESATLWLVLGKTAAPKPAPTMMDVSDALPDDIDALRALILAERAAHAAIVSEHNAITVERDKLAARNERLEAIIQEIRRAHFGRKSERITDDQLAFALEELETSLAKAETEDEKADPALKTERTRKRRASRNENLDHLPHEEVVIEPDSTVCPCCGGDLHVIGEDTSQPPRWSSAQSKSGRCNLICSAECAWRSSGRAKCPFRPLGYRAARLTDRRPVRAQTHTALGAKQRQRPEVEPC